MAISFIAKKQRIFAEAKKKDAKPALKKLAEAVKNMNRLSGDEKEKLKELVNAVYEKFVEKPTTTKKAETEKPTKKPSRSISQILKEFKAKIGAEKWREATRGTDIYRDMERPALPRGKRIVRKKGKTSNQYGTFKNKVGSTYYESRSRHSDVNQPSTKRYPKLEDGGMMFAKGGLLEKIKKSDTISERDILLMKRRMNANNNDTSVREVLDYYTEIGENPRLDAEQTKKGYNFLMNLWKSPTGKVRTNNPFSEREQKVLENFSHFEFEGFMNGQPVYIVMAKNGSSFEYYYSGGSMKIIGENGYYAGGGRTGKKRLKRKKVTRQNPNYDRKADSGLVAKPQGHRFTDKLAKRLNKPSYAKPTQEQIEKYRGKGVYSENRQDKSDVKPNRNYPSLGDGGRTGKKRLKRKKVTRQNPNYDKKADSGLVAKPQGHRFTDKLAKRLGKPSYAKPTQEQIEKYRGKGVYSENRQDKSDVKPNRNYPSL
jgi:hypothetical protein